MYIFLSAGFLLVPKCFWIRTSCGSTWFHLVRMTPRSWWRSSLPVWLPWCQFNSAAWSSTHWPTSCLSLPSTRSVKLYSQFKFLDFLSMKFFSLIFVLHLLTNFEIKFVYLTFAFTEGQWVWRCVWWTTVCPDTNHDHQTEGRGTQNCVWSSLQGDPRHHPQMFLWDHR